MSDNETADLRKVAQQAADRGSLLSVYPTTVVRDLIARIETAEASLDDLREIVRWAGVQLGAPSIEHLRAGMHADRIASGGQA